MNRGWSSPDEGLSALLDRQSERIVLNAAERQVRPGGTARFPFAVTSAGAAPSLHDLDVVSEDPNFDRGWAHIVAVAGDTAAFRQYVLQVRPVDVQRHQYGTYPLIVVWREHGGPPIAAARCELTVKPCARVKVLPAGPGELSLSIENCSETGIEVSVTVGHHGSGWSRGWEFELGAGEGPFEFSEKVDLPSGAHGGALDLSVSAEGITLFEKRIRLGRLGSWRKWSRKVIGAVGAIAVAGGVAAIIAAFHPGPVPQPQTIAFTSVPPGYAKPATTYDVAATGGRSGNPVTFAVDPSAASVCSISGATVTFNAPGTCVIDANQAGNARFRPAPQAQQTVQVSRHKLRRQAIIFTTTPPSGPVPGTTYQVAATGGRSGNPVNLTVDPSAASVCSISGGTVTFNAPGTCVIDANQPGNARFRAARQAQQTVTVSIAGLLSQAITFTTTPPSGPLPGTTYQVAATGGRSGSPVNLTIDPPDTSVCSIKGGTVTFNAPGICVIDANQQGNARFRAAPQAQQRVPVNLIPQAINFTTTPPSGPFPGDTYPVTATGGRSGNPVNITIDPSDASVCSYSGGTVTFNAAGTCVIDANQQGNADYQPAPQAVQTVTVNSPIQ